MTNAITPEGYYSEQQVCQFLGKTIATLRGDHCRRSNNVPPKTKLGGLILYSKASFDAWIKSKEIVTEHLQNNPFRVNYRRRS